LSFGSDEEVAEITATEMSSRWLQRKQAVDSAMRVGGGRRRRQTMMAAAMLSCDEERDTRTR